MSFITSKLALNIFLHSVILFIFLSLFYMYYISELTSIHLNNELVSIMKDNIKNSNYKILNSYYYDYYKNMYVDEDISKKEINERVFNLIYLILGILITLLVLFIIYLLGTESLVMMDVLSIFFENILTFMCIGGIEYMFFTNVASKYIPVKPSFVYNTLLSKIKI